jgi:hypothetical protein
MIYLNILPTERHKASQFAEGVCVQLFLEGRAGAEIEDQLISCGITEHAANFPLLNSSTFFEMFRVNLKVVDLCLDLFHVYGFAVKEILKPNRLDHARAADQTGEDAS